MCSWISQIVHVRLHMAGIDPSLCNMRALCLHVQGVERLAGGHEETVAFGAAEADISADFREQNLADACAVRRKDMHAVVSLADPAGADPDISINVGANAVGEPC